MKLTINESMLEGFVSIWWYRDGEFWSFDKSLEDAEEFNGYLQYSNTQNHLTLWRQVINRHICNEADRKSIISKGYKSIDRGRIVYNIRAQCFEILCSPELQKDKKFIQDCIKYFELSGKRYSFIPMYHYTKHELTGNPVLDASYYETE